MLRFFYLKARAAKLLLQLEMRFDLEVGMSLVNSSRGSTGQNELLKWIFILILIGVIIFGLKNLIGKF